MDKTRKIFLLSNIVLIGFFIAIIFHYLCASLGDLPNFYSTFLLHSKYPEWVFGDFMWILDASKNLSPFNVGNDVVNYFPLVYFLMFPLTLIKHRLVALLFVILTFLTFFIYENIKNFQCENLTNLQNFQNIFILTTMTYPFLYLLERGNLDMIILIFMTAFVYLFKSKKFLLSAFFMAIINAIKPFTIIFLILFLCEKKYKELFYCVLLSFLLIVAGFVFLNGDFWSQIQGLLLNLKLYQDRFLYTPWQGHDNSSSVFMALKFFFCFKSHLISPDVLIKLYSTIMLVLTGIISYFTWKEKVFWKQITLLTLYTLCVPFVIFDYKLILLFIPLWLFVNTEKQSKLDIFYVILFGLLLIPKKAIPVIAFTKIFVVPFSNIINPIIMLVFMGLIIYEQLYTQKNKEIE